MRISAHPTPNTPSYLTFSLWSLLSSFLFFLHLDIPLSLLLPGPFLVPLSLLTPCPFLTSFLPSSLPFFLNLSLLSAVSGRANSLFRWRSSHLHTYQSVWTIRQKLLEGGVINMLISLPLFILLPLAFRRRHTIRILHLSLLHTQPFNVWIPSESLQMP